MRTLTAALQAAIGSGTRECKVELIDWVPHYRAVYSGGPFGRTDAALAGDGALVQAYNDGAGRVYVRRVLDPTQPSWGSWTLLTGLAATGAGVCLAQLSDRLRLFWQDSATTLIYAADSLDNGGTWSAPASLFDAGGAAAGIGADGASSTVFVLYAAAANTYRVAAWTLAGTWSKADWTLGNS